MLSRKLLFVLAFLISSSTVLNVDAASSAIRLQVGESSFLGGSSALSTTSSQLRTVNSFSNNRVILFDQDQEQLIEITNLLFAAELRIAILDLNFKIKKVFQAPETSLAQGFSINSIDLFPTETVKDVKKPGLLILDTTRGPIIVNLVSLEANMLQFGIDFFNGPHEEVKFRELRKPIYTQ